MSLDINSLFAIVLHFRQPVLEGLGWVTHWFYLPLALFIPTPQMIIHSEFNFIYQFLIHTELIGDLGLLGNILNTASHHRVHHGANRYCLDKNYGGWLSVWDRMFGTFQEEKLDEEIVYGLVDQPRFFNVIKHQLFYFTILSNKTNKDSSNLDKIKSYLYGPGWFPNMNLPRLGDNNLVDKKPLRTIHTSQVETRRHLTILLQLISMILVHDFISLNFSTLPSTEVIFHCLSPNFTLQDNFIRLWQ